MFRDFVKEHNPKDMLDVDEFLAMRKEVLAELSKDGEKKASVNYLTGTFNFGISTPYVSSFIL